MNDKKAPEKKTDLVQGISHAVQGIEHLAQSSWHLVKSAALFTVACVRVAAQVTWTVVSAPFKLAGNLLHRPPQDPQSSEPLKAQEQTPGAGKGPAAGQEPLSTTAHQENAPKEQSKVPTGAKAEASRQPAGQHK